MALNIGCQTYTWQMSYDKYTNRLTHILDIVQKAGFRGVEPEVCMLGAYRDAPLLLAEHLRERNLTLGALCLALPWNNREETAEEAEEASFAIEWLKHFPGTLLTLVNLPGKDRSDLPERQKNALSCMNEVAKRADGVGIACAFHPNSPTGSIFRTKEDYEVMFDGLDTRYLGYAPDTGHIANGGMDPMEVIRANRSIIRHVHFKDITADRKWTSMGDGVIDHPAIMKFLEETNYHGWIMVEEESERAEADPDTYTIRNGRYMASVAPQK